MIKLEFCGRLRPLAPPELRSIVKPASVSSIRDLRDWLTAEVPLLGEELAAPLIKLVVNDAILHDLDMPVRDGDEIAFLPPMSGG